MFNNFVFVLECRVNWTSLIHHRKDFSEDGSCEIRLNWLQCNLNNCIVIICVVLFNLDSMTLCFNQLLTFLTTVFLDQCLFTLSLHM